MNNILPDLKICQEAFKKGIIKESKFSFVKFPSGEICIMETNTHPNFNIYPAPLTDEILKVLPEKEIFFNKGEDGYLVQYGPLVMIENSVIEVIDKKLSNALLLLAIKLKSEGMLK